MHSPLNVECQTVYSMLLSAVDDCRSQTSCLNI